MNQIKKFAAKTFMMLFSLFPIKQNKILFMSYDGGQFSCNPKYITEYILANHKQEFDIVWILNKKNKYPFNTVQAMSIKAFFHFATARIIVSNQRLPGFFSKREGQFYLQTWHSSLRLKQIEKDAQDTLDNDYIERAIRDSSMCDLLLSGSQKSSEIFRKAFWYKGEIFERGTPRNDILFSENNEKIENIRKRINLKQSRIALYAPTFRKNKQIIFPGENFKATVNKYFEGEWELAVKLHPHIKESDGNTEGLIIKDLDDTQELLACADILVTDYSSLMFDYALTGKPIILYVPDLSEYVEKERELYFSMKELPFPAAQTEKELNEILINWDQASYKKKLEEFLMEVGTFENGSASAAVTNKLRLLCMEKEMNYIETI